MRRWLLLAAAALLLLAKTGRSALQDQQPEGPCYATELPLLPPFDSTTDVDALGRYWPLSWSVEVARHGEERSLSLSIDPASHDLSAFEQVREQVAFQLARFFFPEFVLEGDVDRVTDRAVAKWLDLKVSISASTSTACAPRPLPPLRRQPRPLKRVEWSTRMMVRGAEFSLFLAEEPANNLAENVILKDVMNLRGSVGRPLHVLELGAYEGATSSWISEFMVSRALHYTLQTTPPDASGPPPRGRRR